MLDDTSQQVVSDAVCRAPLFRLSGDQFTVLPLPADFLRELHALLSRASCRVLVAALYLDTNELEEKLVATLALALETNPGLEATLLFDRTRSSRRVEGVRHPSSFELLQPLLERFGARLRIHFYQTALLTPLLKTLLPSKALHEVIGVQHLKVFIGDDDIILSGANLSHQYFTNRQDRYWLLRKCPALVDWYAQLLRIVCDFSFCWPLPLPDTLLPPPGGDPERSPRDFNRSLRLALEVLLEPQKSSAGEDSQLDTWVFPTVQLGSAGVMHDEQVTSSAILRCGQHSGGRLCLASPYFNIAAGYATPLLNRLPTCGGRLDVVAAHPTANSFHGAQGPRGHIPALYLATLHRFWQDVQAAGQQEQVVLWEWVRAGWTFHAKGFWFAPGPDRPVSVAAVGSSNWGERSAYRDLESQILVVTANAQLQHQLTTERDCLLQYGARVDKTRFLRNDFIQIPMWVRLAARMGKAFL
eukprot:GGOE01014597.1.p1 GENE.GGOE01014597.1~~GGOE01014597.1.p1  ORF type:complete len:471 (-),score=102.74 GGOE01014597.1:90-1502(-)